MDTSTTLCGPCSARHITKPSTHWCSECEEAICDDCQEHHKVLKATRSHELIPINKYKSLPSFITDIKQTCTYHNEKYQQYCVAHALPLCYKCIKHHQKCNVIPLDEVTNNVKTTGLYQDLETRLVYLLQNIYIIKKDRKANLASIEAKKEEHLAEIQQIRTKINKHLDKLENETKKDLEKQVCQCKKNIQKILLSVKEKENLIEEYQTNLQSIKQHASDFQTFLLMRDIEMKVFENEQYLQSLIETRQIGQVEIVCRVDQGVISILKTLNKFGSIEIKTMSSDILFLRAKDKINQLRVTPTKTINDLKFILQKQITTDGQIVAGCCMSVNGEYFFSDYYVGHTLIVIAPDGTFKFNMSLSPSYGFDITFIDEKTVAITSGGSPEHMGIDIIDTKTRNNIKFINLPGRPWGITHDQGTLFVCVDGRGIYKVKTVDYSISHVISCKLSACSYISTFDNKIYYTDRNENTVVCCDRYGSCVWTFRDTLVLMRPSGISVDNDGNVYVIGEDSWNVVIISNDGKHHRQFLSDDDGLRGPSAIFFDKQTKTLLVANKSETAFLFNVAKND